MTATPLVFRMVQRSDDRTAPVHAALTERRAICGTQLTRGYSNVAGRITVTCSHCLHLMAEATR